MPEATLSPFATFFVYFCVGTSLLLGILNSRMNSHRIALFNRWARWLGVSLGAAYLVYDAGWLDRPFWALAFIFVVGWMLIETVYTWLAINALSHSGFELFPRFERNDTGEEWPAQKRLIEMKDWLRSKGFERVSAVVANLGHDVRIRSTVFQSEDQETRFQILFIPRRDGDIGFSIAFASETTDGRRVITDNHSSPFGGFYPENWDVVRKPWCRDAARLLKRHRRRVAKYSIAQYKSDPVDDLNRQQQEIERINLEYGFLVPTAEQEEHGKITWGGRYRVWKEVWLLNYFGISLH